VRDQVSHPCRKHLSFPKLQTCLRS
jgi:hypothetical protein